MALYCKDCGSEALETSSFCASCGGALTRVCQTCRTENVPSTGSYRRCGAALASGMQQTTSGPQRKELVQDSQSVKRLPWLRSLSLASLAVALVVFTSVGILLLWPGSSEGPASGWDDLLAYIPDSPEYTTGELFMVDYEAGYNALGVSGLPGTTSCPEYVGTLTDGELELLVDARTNLGFGYSGLDRLPDVADEVLGFDSCQVERMLFVGSYSDSVRVFELTKDEANVYEALEASGYEQVLSSGIGQLSIGDDFGFAAEPVLSVNINAFNQLAFDDGAWVASSNTEAIERALTSKANPDLIDLEGALDGAFAVFQPSQEGEGYFNLRRLDGLNNGTERSEAFRAEYASSWGTLESPDRLAFGYAKRVDEDILMVALLYADEVRARENQRELEVRLRTYQTVWGGSSWDAGGVLCDAVDTWLVSNKRSVVVVGECRGGLASMWLDALVRERFFLIKDLDG